MLLSHIIAPDGGLLYTETDLKRFLPEPLNTLTSCFFFLLALYWIIKLKGFSTRHTFLSAASWILLVGSIGGTIYHGLRKYPIFIPMDWVPIMTLCLLASAWFWNKVLGSTITTGAVFILFIIIEIMTRFLSKYGGENLATNINYGLMGLMVLIPLILFLVKIHFFEAKWVLIASLTFTAALFCRIADNWGLMPMGTHFLWHTFGAVATSSMFVFIYRLNEGMRVVYSNPAYNRNLQMKKNIEN